jgi:hypothetical protein
MVKNKKDKKKYQPAQEPSTKWKKMAPHAEPKIPVVCFGDANFIRRTDPCLINHLRDQLKRAEQEGLLIYMEIDEYLTSQRCSACLALTLEYVQIENGDHLYNVLQCTTCGTKWNRDVNAARNILAVVLHQIITGTLTRPYNLDRLVSPSSKTLLVSIGQYQLSCQFFFFFFFISYLNQ